MSIKNGLSRWSALFTALSLLTPLLTRAGILDNWHWRNPVPFPETMRSVCFGGGTFVAVGDGGLIHTSSDGVTWDNGRRPVLINLNKIIYANGGFIAVGNSGTIITSSNAVDWTVQNSGAANDLYAVAFGNGRFVVRGLNGQQVVSTNGTDWTPGTDSSVGPWWITFGNGIFMAAGSGTSVKVSSDGQTWTGIGLPVAGLTWPHALHQVEFGNGIFGAVVSDETSAHFPQAVCHFYTSADGTNWAQKAYLPFGPDASGGGFAHRFLIFLNSAFHEVTDASSYGFVAISVTTDGNSCVTKYAPTNAPAAHSMAYGNGKYLLIEQSGRSWVSADETNWVATYGGVQGSFLQLVQGNSNIVVIGPMFVSSDGVTFNDSSTPPGTFMVAAAFDGTNYVAVGGTDAFGPYTGSGGVSTSTNGTDWVDRTSNSDKKLLAICRGPSRWVAVGVAGRVITSPNTLAWTLRSSGTGNNLNGIAFGNNIYVAVGNSGTVITSTDGISWDVQFAGTTSSLNGILFQNGQFIAVGAGGTILTSPDGANWTSQSTGTTATLRSIAFGNGDYLVGGFDDVNFPSVGDVFLTSTNGTNWQNISVKIPTTTFIRSIAYINHSFWIVGDGGMLLQSDSADGIPHLVGSKLAGGVKLNVTLNPPAGYRVQFRTNLLTDTWHDVYTQTNPITSDIWTDTNAFQVPSGFYQVVSP
jgi:hypothetical protein